MWFYGISQDISICKAVDDDRADLSFDKAIPLDTCIFKYHGNSVGFYDDNYTLECDQAHVLQYVFAVYILARYW